MTAVQMPATGGNPLAREMARHSGMAMRKTKKPAMASNRRLPNGPAASGGGVGWAEVGSATVGTSGCAEDAGLAATPMPAGKRWKS